jgi:hypothetical protein
MRSSTKEAASLLCLGFMGLGEAASALDALNLINEIDYDQVGVDNAEWIEIRNPEDGIYSLTDTDLVLYDADLNGNCTEYCRVSLEPLVFLGPGQYVVIGDHPCAALPLCTSTDAIQNGLPDAIVVERNGFIIDSIEYGSGQTHSVCTFIPVENRVTTVDSDTIDGSLRSFLGLWMFAGASTPCATNSVDWTDVPDEPAPPSWTLIKALYKE